jgi:hypothetical protein
MLEIANNFTGDCGNRIASSKLKMVFKGFFPYAKCRLLKWREIGDRRGMNYTIANHT